MKTYASMQYTKEDTTMPTNPKYSKLGVTPIPPQLQSFGCCAVLPKMIVEIRIAMLGVIKARRRYSSRPQLALWLEHEMRSSTLTSLTLPFLLLRNFVVKSLPHPQMMGTATAVAIWPRKTYPRVLKLHKYSGWTRMPANKADMIT
jgi:hypothetical protein